MKQVVLTGCLAAACAYAQPQTVPPPQISVTASPREVFIADPITYTVRIVADAQVEVKPPDEVARFGLFTVRRFRQKQRAVGGGRIQREYRYELAVFDIGEHAIAAYPVWYRQAGAAHWRQTESEEITVTVKSMREDGEPPRLRPLKPKLSRVNRAWAWLLGVLLLAAAGIALWRRMSGKAQRGSAPAVLPAHIIALRQLEELRQQRLVEQGKLPEFFARLSGCVRHYVENRFYVRAPHMSTEEFMGIAQASSLLQAGHKRLLREFLALADLVKFARYGSSPQEAEQAYNAAHHFVEQTKQENSADSESTA